MSDEDFVLSDDIIEEEIEYIKITRKRRHRCEDY